MSQRTLIISDTHLGRNRCAAISAQALRPLWAGCSHVIVNGDVAEVHHPTCWAAAARELLSLRDLCEYDGVELTLLPGNHDPFVNQQRHVHLAGQNVLVMHGDAVHPAVAPWSRRARRMRQANREALEAMSEHERESIEGRLQASAAASFADWHPPRVHGGGTTISKLLLHPIAVAQVLWYWRAFPRLAAAFVKRYSPQSRIIVLGHAHRHGLWRVDDITVIDTGCFGFPARPWAVTLDDDRVLSVWAIEYRSGRYALSSRTIETFELPAQVHGAAVKSNATSLPAAPRHAA